MWTKTTMETGRNSRAIVVAVVYLSLFLDNVLLTVVVPIIPDYLCTLDGNSTINNEDDENGRVGLLLSSKALMQLILNPAVGIFTATFGYTKPLLLGNLSLLLAAMLFAFGQTYEVLFLARSIQGISSACIGVSGMSLVASQYPEEDKRSKIMGFVLGSIALGVLVGYPIGSVLYDLEGKMAPFLLVSCFIVITICLQIFTLDVKMNTEKWQLGTVFIPDSVGYLIGTNFFGMIAYRYGRSKIAVLAMLLVGISVILIPSSQTMSQLAVPHLGMGLGIGVADAALVPLLATFVDQNGNYGPVYSIQQVAVSLAYSLGPIVGGEMVKTIGFQWVMRIIGLMNVGYCPLLIYLTLERRKLLTQQDEKKDYETFQKSVMKYERFRDSDDDL
ncbi:chromaffin granule amine transporter-like isoform X2 [Bombus pyrosoma]|uniref:chromaffin granule amine transporter-like isoform X2 n=1 Tax=Bombus pyrosoma TaxID=396416 RepID=UPI001CB93468|nr:chromaffin granule amine transporter-like isoform X2 [Bombus pyrosoma]